MLPSQKINFFIFKALEAEGNTSETGHDKMFNVSINNREKNDRETKRERDGKRKKEGKRRRREIEKGKD